MDELALKSIRSRPVVHTPYDALVPVGSKRDILADWGRLSERADLPTDDLYLALPAFSSRPIPPQSDVGQIRTHIPNVDSWRVNVLLSWLPSYLRPADKTLGVSSHFPSSGFLEVSLTRAVSENRLRAVINLVHLAENETRYLLFDANLSRRSKDGHIMPKSWLWDIYDELAKRLGARQDYDADSCLQVVDGKVTYGKNGNGYFIALDGTKYTPDEMTGVSTVVTDSYASRVVDLLQDLYDEGVVYFPTPPAVTLPFRRYNERLWIATDPLYPSAVELLYN